MYIFTSSSKDAFDADVTNSVKEFLVKLGFKSSVFQFLGDIERFEEPTIVSSEQTLEKAKQVQNLISKLGGVGRLSVKSAIAAYGDPSFPSNYINIHLVKQ